MENKGTGIIALLLIVIIGCVLAGSAAWRDLTGQSAAQEANAYARAQEAWAYGIAAQRELAEAEAQAARAQGERAVLEAAARSVDNNTQLVNYQARRGDTATALGIVGAAIIFSYLKRKNDRPATYDEGEL